MIDRSWAIARYDSRDGYGSHPLEGRYVAADEATPRDRFAEACDPGEELPEFHEVNDTEPQPQPSRSRSRPPPAAPAPAPAPAPHLSRTTIRGMTAVPATPTAPVRQVVARCRTTRTRTSTTTRTTTAAPATLTAPVRRVAAGEPLLLSRPASVGLRAGRCRNRRPRRRRHDSHHPHRGAGQRPAHRVDRARQPTGPRRYRTEAFWPEGGPSCGRPGATTTVKVHLGTLR